LAKSTVGERLQLVQEERQEQDEFMLLLEAI
jgi:hypothetical protein